MRKLLLIVLLILGCKGVYNIVWGECEDPKAINYEHPITQHQSCYYCVDLMTKRWEHYISEGYTHLNLDSMLVGSQHGYDSEGCCFIDGAVNQNTYDYIGPYLVENISSQDSTYCIFEEDD